MIEQVGEQIEGCGSMTKERSDVVDAVASTEMPHHYTECGLDYVYLRNGFERIDTEWGEAVSVVHAEALHRLIGEGIANSSEPMTGQQLRFVRVGMDMTQAFLGNILGHSDRQTVANWERAKEKEVSKAHSIIVRALYLEFLKGGGASSITAMVNRLADAEKQAFAQRRVDFHNTAGSWEIELHQKCA